MALIDSPRLTAADRDHWQQMTHYDDVLSQDRRLDRLATQAVADIQAWAADGPAVCSTSWGKDSVVTAHLVATAAPDIPLVWVRGDPWETPECEAVRDAFLAAHPHIRCEERPVVYSNPRRGEAGWSLHPDPPRPPSWTFDQIIPERHVTGVRAQESRTRALSAAVHGVATGRTCRPILSWTADHVFAYLARHDLPVHPAYAMTMGGMRDRRWIRVHALAGTPASARNEPHYLEQLAEWEDAYYGDVLDAAIASRHTMWAS